MSKETSETVASIAGRVLQADPDILWKDEAAMRKLVDDAKSLAGSALAQREEEVPGTHAYDLLASFAEADLGVTEALIQMTAATVLSVLIREEGGGRANVAFSPKDMDDMHKMYDIETGREGMLTFVRIVPKEGTAQTLVDTYEDYSGDLKDQAEPKPERPLWFVRDGAGLHEYPSKVMAEEAMLKSVDPIATVENRHCGHPECPSEHCNIWKDSDEKPGNGMNPDGN